MPHNVRVLANAESITTNNQASEQKDNFLIKQDLVAFTKENFERLLDENLKFRRIIEDLQEALLINYKRDVFDIAPKMTVTFTE